MNHEENKAIAEESLPMNETPNTTAPNDAPNTETAPPVEASHENSDTPKTPPPEFFQFMLNALQQRGKNQHRHRALNPESAQCDEGTKPYLILKDNQKVEDLERLLPHPVRKRDTVSIDRADSFIAYVKAHQITGATAIYQSTTSAGDLQFKAIIDDHETGDKGQANWQQHKVLFTPKLSREWRIWNEVNERDVSQEQFALFIERNMPDIADPAGSTLLEIVRTLESKKNVNFKSGIRLDNGDFSIQYEETSTAKAGEKGTLDIPQIITLSIPVYDGGAPYAIEARFRYRINEGRLRMWYELVRIQDIRDHADNSISQQISAGLPEVPLYHGSK